jgi:hypothetical protein
VIPRGAATAETMEEGIDGMVILAPRPGSLGTGEGISVMVEHVEGSTMVGEADGRTAQVAQVAQVAQQQQQDAVGGGGRGWWWCWAGWRV